MAECLPSRSRARAAAMPRSHPSRGFLDSRLGPGAAAEADRDGILSGIPFGVKDIIETRGLSTEYGSPIYKGRIGTEDAAIVRGAAPARRDPAGQDRRRTAFAYRTPAPTRNPRDLAHTPGGSSSGSAAAVAAGMVPVALGTQTRGSVLRPASYCGVTGFKASFGLLPMEGVLPFAKSLDTLGFFTHTPADMLALWEAIGQPVGTVRGFCAGSPRPDARGRGPDGGSVSARHLRGSEARAVSIRLNRYRRDAGQGGRCEQHRDVLRSSPVPRTTLSRARLRLADLADLVREGLQISLSQYDEARRYIAACKAGMAGIYEATPVIVVPAATGPAPFGLASTGDARMNAPWTALGTPAISIPMPVQSGLPLGLQLTADHGEDARVIRMAVRLQGILDGGGRRLRLMTRKQAPHESRSPR